MLSVGYSDSNTSDDSFVEYLKNVINSAIDLKSSGAYSNGFDVKIVPLNDSQFEVYFIPFMPFDVLINKDLYYKIGQALSVALTPFATYLEGNGMVIKSTNSDDLSCARGLVYRFMKATVNRLNFDSVDEINFSSGVIPLMSNSMGNPICRYDINVQNNMIGVSGISGGGKSYMLMYLAQAYYSSGASIFIVDPKNDDKLYRFSRKRSDCTYLSPVNGKSDLDFVTKVNNLLNNCVRNIQERQTKMANDPDYNPRRIVLILDELLALTATMKRQEKVNLMSTLTKVIVMGRASKIGVIVASQQFSADALPTACREQLSLKIMLSPQLNKQNCSFLFPELEDPSGIIIPEDNVPYGRGIVQIADGVSPVLPLLAPTFEEVC